LIEPFLSDDAFLKDVRIAHESPRVLNVWWIGQSGFLLAYNGCHVLLDPYLSDSLTQKYSNTDKPHVRISRRVIAPERLDFIDVVSSSHNHTDHLDAETLKALDWSNANMSIVCSGANVAFAATRLGYPESRFKPVNVPMDAGMVNRDTRWASCAGFTAIPAAHETLETDEMGRHRYVGFVISLGGFAIYHSGDTVLYDGMVERLRSFNVDVALLPINGRAHARRVAGNLWGREAAWLAKEIGAKVVIPCHYDMFEFNTATPDEFVAECERLGQQYRVLKLGERWSSSELEST
jgi:L-ascorbate metabolism protein UlaG (beta-lactamase superfamily)